MHPQISALRFSRQLKIFFNERVAHQPGRRQFSIRRNRAEISLVRSAIFFEIAGEEFQILQGRGLSVATLRDCSSLGQRRCRFMATPREKR
jgi:hypothetical protein